MEGVAFAMRSSRDALDGGATLNSGSYSLLLKFQFQIQDETV